jgi:LysR family transcriptional regulator for metE and metH
MGTFLDSRHLRLIAEVARAQSVTRAADRLHVTQSAVSHQLREIEDKLGTQLFLRSGRRMLPTGSGLLLVRAGEKVLDEIIAAEAAVMAMADHRGGEFRICTQCHTGYHWLPPLLEDVRRGFPNVDLRIAVEYTMHPIAALLDGKLDLAIVNRVPRDKRLRAQPLFRDEQAAVVDPSHPFAARKYVTPRELGAERLLLYSPSLDESFAVKEILRPAGVEPRNVSFVQLTEAILEMVKARLGITVLPTWSIGPALAAGVVKAVRITPRGVHRQWSAVSLAAAAPSQFLQEFLQLLQRHAPALPPSAVSTRPSARRPAARAARGRRGSAQPAPPPRPATLSPSER